MSAGIFLWKATTGYYKGTEAWTWLPVLTKTHKLPALEMSMKEESVYAQSQTRAP